jgi:hypothetical protein
LRKGRCGCGCVRLFEERADDVLIAAVVHMCNVTAAPLI